MSTEKVAAPGEVFNYAQHLLELNQQRADKTAYIDDQGKLSYGELDKGARSLGAALLDAGIQREERVLLLMHDCNDWPVCFLGAIYAGIVPVAVNTLLTADDYLYMLQHSRAREGLARSFQITSVVMPMTLLQNVMLAVQGGSGHSFLGAGQPGQ